MVPLLYLGFLLASMYVISKSSDLFIDAASSLGIQLHLKDYLIGSLIVGVGTSLPELITSLAAVVEEEPVLVAPNVYGTIIANICTGLGLAVIGLYFFVPNGHKTRFFTLRNPSCGGMLNFEGLNSQGTSNLFDTPLVFAIFSVFLSYFLCMDGVFSRTDAIVFLFGYLAFLVNELSERKREEEPSTEGSGIHASQFGKMETTLFDRLRILGGSYVSFLFFLVAAFVFLNPFDRIENLILFLIGLFGVLIFDTLMFKVWRGRRSAITFDGFKEFALRRTRKLILVLYIALSLVVVFFSGTIIVKSVIYLAEYFDIGSTVLAASVIAVGTSLPDVVVAMKVARKGRHQLLIGHIIQSNVFDVFLIMAVCGLIVPLPIDPVTVKFTIMFAIAVTVALLPIVRDNKITLPEGILMVIAFAVFIGVLYGAI